MTNESQKNAVSIDIFSNDIPPCEIAKIIAVELSRAIDKHAPRGRSANLKYTQNIASYQSRENEESDIDNHILDIREQLGQNADKIAELAALGCSVQCSCVIYCSYSPCLNLSPDAIEFLQKIRASLDVDIYPGV